MKTTTEQVLSCVDLFLQKHPVSIDNTTQSGSIGVHASVLFAHRLEDEGVLQVPTGYAGTSQYTFKTESFIQEHRLRSLRLWTDGSGLGPEEIEVFGILPDNRLRRLINGYFNKYVLFPKVAFERYIIV